MTRQIGIFGQLAAALDEADTAPRDPLEQYWTREDIGQFKAFCAGAPLPTSLGALELLATTCKLDWEV